MTDIEYLQREVARFKRLLCGLEILRITSWIFPIVAFIIQLVINNFEIALFFLIVPWAMGLSVHLMIVEKINLQKHKANLHRLRELGGLE